MDQVGLERTAAISRGSAAGVSRGSLASELYARVVATVYRCLARSACRRDARQRRHIYFDIVNPSVQLEYKLVNVRTEGSRFGTSQGTSTDFILPPSM